MVTIQLVEIKKLDLVTNTIAIADGVVRDHDTIIKLVDRNEADLEEFGKVGFEIRAGYNVVSRTLKAIQDAKEALTLFG